MKRQCPTCITQGKKSRVYPRGSSRTLMHAQHYWDEEGDEHYHDPNATSTSYCCSEGHTWTSTTYTECPAPGCDYNARRRDD